mmetsp:Transcript_31873/g.35725  ORF Transcript_31873/g.35725 Transcript_31873/m.35725 type:complete len:155 (-) Transcript_31873:46-510(-)
MMNGDDNGLVVGFFQRNEESPIDRHPHNNNSNSNSNVNHKTVHHRLRIQRIFGLCDLFRRLTPHKDGRKKKILRPHQSSSSIIIMSMHLTFVVGYDMLQHPKNPVATTATATTATATATTVLRHDTTQHNTNSINNNNEEYSLLEEAVVVVVVM